MNHLQFHIIIIDSLSWSVCSAIFNYGIVSVALTQCTDLQFLSVPVCCLLCESKLSPLISLCRGVFLFFFFRISRYTNALIDPQLTVLLGSCLSHGLLSYYILRTTSVTTVFCQTHSLLFRSFLFNANIQHCET